MSLVFGRKARWNEPEQHTAVIAGEKQSYCVVCGEMHDSVWHTIDLDGETISGYYTPVQCPYIERSPA